MQSGTSTSNVFFSEHQSFLDHNVTVLSKNLLIPVRILLLILRFGEIPVMSSLKQDAEARWNSELMMMNSNLRKKDHILTLLSA